MDSNEKLYDLTIIGGGPTGLFGLFYACLRQMETLLIDSLEELGGQLTALYPEKAIYDMPGFPSVPAKYLAEQMAEQAMMHRKQDIVLGERVETLVRQDDDTFLMQTDKGRSIRSRTVVITTGAGAFRPNRLSAPGLTELEGKSVFYFLKDKSILKGKRIVIVGGGDSALDWVLNLNELAAETVLVHRRDAFRAHEDTVVKVNALTHVKQYLFYEVKDVGLGATGDMQQVVIENNKTGERLMLNADALLVNLGFVADVGPIKNWGLELKANQIIVNSRMETNITGVYAAGDVATFPGKLKLIATGTGEASIAVNAAKHHMDPTQREQPVHSSSLFEKKPTGTAG